MQGMAKRGQVDDERLRAFGDAPSMNLESPAVYAGYFGAWGRSGIDCWSSRNARRASLIDGLLKRLRASLLPNRGELFERQPAAVHLHVSAVASHSNRDLPIGAPPPRGTALHSIGSARTSVQRFLFRLADLLMFDRQRSVVGCHLSVVLPGNWIARALGALVEHAGTFKKGLGISHLTPR